MAGSGLAGVVTHLLSGPVALLGRQRRSRLTCPISCGSAPRAPLFGIILLAVGVRVRLIVARLSACQHHASPIARTLRLQILRRQNHFRISRRRHRHRRPERLRKIERPRRHPLGARRAIGQGAARRRNGGRHFQRHRLAQAGRHRRGFADLHRIARRSSASIGTTCASRAAFFATATRNICSTKPPAG